MLDSNDLRMLDCEHSGGMEVATNYGRHEETITGRDVMTKMEKFETKETSDQLKKIWLVNFKGFTLETTRREPHAGMFGKIHYKNVWLLKKKNE